jgi:hypothetical protein
MGLARRTDERRTEGKQKQGAGSVVLRTMRSAEGGIPIDEEEGQAGEDADCDGVNGDVGG